MDYSTSNRIPPPPATQALACDTFTPPPLDGSMLVPEVYDWHLQHSPSHPLFVYDNDEGAECVIHWSTAVRAVHRCGRVIQTRVDHTGGTPPVVAILASTDTITFFTVIIGIVRAGYTAFPISTRNSPAAVAHLLQKVGVAHVLVGPESALQALIAESLTLVKDQTKPPTSAMLSFTDLYSASDDELFVPLAPVKHDVDDAAYILHSSGSTAFPKPIVWTHRRVVQAGLTPYFGEIDLTGRRLALHSMPMFHGMGTMQVAWTAMSGIVLSVFQPRSPAIIPEPDSVMKASVATKSDIIFCVPSFVEAWSRNAEYVKHLKSIKGILYGGGPLSKPIGDSLWNQGVKLFVLYGCTEVGIISPIIPRTSEKDWEYFRIAGNMNPKFVPDGNGNSELVIAPSPYELPCVFNTKIDGVDAYATSDLLTPHPSKPGFWRVYGRVDDQIMHSTGEKTNPGPLENILNQDPHILSSVIFGRGRFYPGVAVDPKPEFRFDPVDELALTEFRNLIWPTVERMNAYAPQHSRIFKEMILISSPKKPFTYTAKNTARRQAIIADYEEEIDSLYSAVQKSAQPHIRVPTEWTRDTVLEFIRVIVSEVMKRAIGDNEDIFESGCDSLQATWIRNTILNALEKTSAADPRAISGSFVYQYPTIASLAAYVLELTGGAQAQNVMDVEDVKQMKIDAMHAMLRKYGSGFRKHVASPSKQVEEGREGAGRGEVILLTGTTGWLGSLMLAKLLQEPSVRRVYAANRRGGRVRERQVRAFEDRGIDTKLVTDEKLVLLEADLTVEDLGLGAERSNEIASSVTHIIHNAYPVDFNKSLASFESAIVSLRRLVDFALASPLPSPPRFVFISSVSSVNQHPGSERVREELVDAQCALASGYPESKWVCEHMLGRAAVEAAGLKPIVVRVGQLCGMSDASGRWNTKEWVPALFKSSIQLGCLPFIDNDVSWIPIDIAARVVCEMRNADPDPDASASASGPSPITVLHLAHPHPVAWSTLFNEASHELTGIPLVPYAEWVRRLTRSASAVAEGKLETEAAVRRMEESPALRILDFFQACDVPLNAGAKDGADADADAKEGREAMGLRRLALDRACGASPTLAGLESAPLAGEDVKSWIAYWKSVGFV